MENNQNMLTVLDTNNGGTAYCSLIAEDARDRATLYNATSAPQERLADHIGEVVPVKHIYAEPVRIVDDNTGEVTDTARVVLITQDGVGYQATSKGVLNAVKRLVAIFGEPSAWEDPLPVKVKQVQRGQFRTLTLEVVI